MKYIYVFLLALCLSQPGILRAQFDDIRFPLTPEEISLYKKNKVMGEMQKFVDKGVPKSYRARALDTSGKLLASLSYASSQYYRYDDKGRVVAHLDSVRNMDGTFTVKQYDFTYDEKTGKLTQANTPAGIVNYNFDAKRNILTQAHRQNDTMLLSKYYFDAMNRLVVIEGFDYTNRLVSKVERNFASNGLLHMEEIVASDPSGSDSTMIFYVYNPDRTLQQKQVFNFIKTFVSKDGSSTPTHSAEQNSAGTYMYTYDKNRNKLSEEYKHSMDKFSNFYSTWQYNEKGLPVKRTYKLGINEPQTILYEYGFY